MFGSEMVGMAPIRRGSFKSREVAHVGAKPDGTLADRTLLGSRPAARTEGISLCAI